MSNSSVSSALLEGAARPHDPSQPYTSNLRPTDGCLPHVNTSHLTSEAAADTRLRRESLEPGHRWAHDYLKEGNRASGQPFAQGTRSDMQPYARNLHGDGDCKHLGLTALLSLGHMRCELHVITCD